MIYEIYDIEGDSMGLLRSPLPHEIIQELIDEYHNEYWLEIADFSLDHFVDIYRYEKNYDVDRIFIELITKKQNKWYLQY